MAPVLTAATTFLLSGCGGSLDPQNVNLDYAATAVVVGNATRHLEVRLHLLNRGDANVIILHGECPGRDFEIELRDGSNVAWHAAGVPGCVDIARLVPVAAAGVAAVVWRFPVSLLRQSGLGPGEFDVWVRLMPVEPALDSGFVPAGAVEIR